MKRFVRTIERLLRHLPSGWENKLFEIVLRKIPFWLLKLIPCSYSTYLKCYYPKRGDVVIDAGAHVGNCSIIFSRLVGREGRVIALEPFRDSFDILKERMKRLGMDNVIPVNKGLWESDTMLSLRLFTGSTVGANICNEVDKDILKDNIQIDCITLDSLVDELKPDRLDMVKMDIEGAEIEALKGADKTLKTLSPCFAIASYHTRNNKKTCSEIEKMLMNRGYSVNTFFPPHLTTCGIKKQG
ncbi:MAG TPA: FkbM family methyltransferase [Nitrospirae bacterium]|nr:hypothetical protein BMS3Abin06_02878 [bacterium BMS3Abin06]HDH12934.1 FkbM family methyltransferase [Nitrospirota bacterium]HDL19859.1 FkbM family methyltransferase [Nitrospirota bacterium]HDZ01654.1 FkbM family methyltransferase [Nitrospirota bacterium]